MKIYPFKVRRSFKGQVLLIPDRRKENPTEKHIILVNADWQPFVATLSSSGGFGLSVSGDLVGDFREVEVEVEVVRELENVVPGVRGW